MVKEWMRRAGELLQSVSLHPLFSLEIVCAALAGMALILLGTLVLLWVRKQRIARERETLVSALKDLLTDALKNAPEMLNTQNPPSVAASVDVLEKGLTLLGRTGSVSPGLFLKLANESFANGAVPQALLNTETALALAEQERDLAAKSIALGNLGIMSREKKDYEAAFKYLSYALTVSREIGHKPSEASHLRNLGILYKNKSDADIDPEMVIEYFQNALSIDTELANRQGEAQDLDHIGAMYLERGDLDLALTYFQDALSLHRDIENRRGEAKTLGNLGLVHQLKGDMESALRYLKNALMIHEELGSRRGEAQTLTNIGLVHQASEDFDLALEYHTDALIIDREIGDRDGEAKDLGSIGMIYYRKGNYRTALKHLREARELLTKTGPSRDLETVENTIREIESYNVN
jgi:tetratricopeptide (TPR) repeat protein